MSGPERPDRPTRADYVSWRTATTRWADDDVYGHMNNATYFELIDTAVNAHLIESTGRDIRTLPAIGVVAEVSCRYFRELGFPEPVDIGLAVERLGGTPGEAVYVGDAVVDVQAARRAGMASVAVTWGAGARDDVVASEPDVVADTVQELREALLGR